MPFFILSNKLPHSDPRYIRWKKSLLKRPPPWNKGKTKTTSVSVRQISQTFKSKKIDNFKVWRDGAFQEIRKASKQPLLKNIDTAVLTGLALGDGHIHQSLRTESLTISLNTKYPGLIKYTQELAFRVFNKRPSLSKAKNSNCMKVQFYQQNISKRLMLPIGNRKDDKIGVPKWIFKEKRLIIGCLKGLFEAEGSLSIHLPTCTYNFQFSNKNTILLDQVETMLRGLGYNPERRQVSVRLRKKAEVVSFKKLIHFRTSENAG